MGGPFVKKENKSMLFQLDKKLGHAYIYKHIYICIYIYIYMGVYITIMCILRDPDAYGPML